MDRGATDRSAMRINSGPSIDRRRFLLGLSAAGVGAVAGCSGEIPDDLRRRPDEVDGDVWFTSLYGSVEKIDPGDPSGRLEAFAFDVGFAPQSDERDLTHVLAQEVTQTATTVSITLRPDLEWSNGEPLTAADVGRWAYMLRMGSSRFIPVPEIRDGTRHPTHGWETVTDVTWDERTVTLEGRFDRGPTPLYDLNAQVARRPPTYYEWLWEAFQDAYDDEPWEDSGTWAEVTDLVESNIWGIAEENRPRAGIRLEADYDGDGWEAAFSGLWYPRRVDNGRIHFGVNDAHPFADRVHFDEVVWKYQKEEDVTLFGLRDGIVDGAMLNEVSEHVVESVPDHIDAFSGPRRSVVTLVPNHGARHLGERDVRAALAHSIDRERLRDDLDLLSVDSVSIPGSDLQPDAWLSSELRNALRPYEYDPDRASALLERAGFTHDGERWRDPDGEPFVFELLAGGTDPTMSILLTEQLEESDIETGYEVIEDAAYQVQRDERYFVATPAVRSCPNAAGRNRARTSEYVRSLIRGYGYRDSGYLEEEVEAAIENDDELRLEPFEGRQRLVFDSVEALQSITVEAPPLGDPDGELREWPYLYHAVKADNAVEIEDTVEHAAICTWIYNYQVPEIELLVRMPWIFHDTDRWSLPDQEDPAWRYVRHGLQPGGLWAALAWGHVDSDRP